MMQLGESMNRDTLKVPMADRKSFIWFTIRSRVFFNITTKRYLKTEKRGAKGINKIAEENKVETRNCLLFLEHYL